MFAVSPIFTGTVTVDGANDILLAGAATGQSPTIQAAGLDADVTLTLQGKGTGSVLIPRIDATGGLLDNVQIGTRLPGNGNFAVLNLGSNTSTTAVLAFNGVVGGFRPLQFQSAGVMRWAIAANNAAETGANAGANLQIDRHSDTGAYLGTALFITRATGVVGIGLAEINGGAINNTTVGATTPSTGRFTTLTATGHLIRSLATALTAAGTTQAAALALTASINVVTTAAAGSGVRLPDMPVGAECIIINRTANTFNIYPQTGDVIDALAANAATTITTNTVKRFVQASATQYFTI